MTESRLVDECRHISEPHLIQQYIGLLITTRSSTGLLTTNMGFNMWELITRPPSRVCLAYICPTRVL